MLEHQFHVFVSEIVQIELGFVARHSTSEALENDGGLGLEIRCRVVVDELQMKPAPKKEKPGANSTTSAVPRKSMLAYVLSQRQL